MDREKYVKITFCLNVPIMRQSGSHGSRQRSGIQAALISSHCSGSCLCGAVALQLVPVLSLQFQNCMLDYTKTNVFSLYFYLLQRKKRKPKHLFIDSAYVKGSYHHLHCHSSQKFRKYLTIFLLLHIPTYKSSSGLIQYLLLIVS